MSRKIVSNYHDRPFVYRYDVPETVLKVEFDWLNDDIIDGFFKYHKVWHHMCEFMGTNAVPGWDAYLGGTYSSGTLIKVADDSETYRIGWYVEYEDFGLCTAGASDVK